MLSMDGNRWSFQIGLMIEDKLLLYDTGLLCYSKRSTRITPSYACQPRNARFFIIKISLLYYLVIYFS